MVKSENLSGFDLTANKETVARGEQITFRLENITDKDKMSGAKSKYPIHHETAVGWRDSFYPAEDSIGHSAYNDIGVNQPPGEGFTRELTASPGWHTISRGSRFPRRVYAAPAGTHRFAYWGVRRDPETGGDSEKEYALGVRFSISGD